MDELVLELWNGEYEENKSGLSSAVAVGNLSGEKKKKTLKEEGA